MTRLMIVFHDMTLGGIQRKVVDLTNHLQTSSPETEIIICLRHKKGIFLNQLPKNITVLGPKFHTKKLDMLWFIFWLTSILFKYRPTHILSFMDLGSIPTLIALKFLFWQKPKLIIGEDILTSQYVYTETRPQLRLKLIKYFYPKADKILVQTPVQKNDLEKIFGFKSKKIIVSPNWLPLNFPPQKITADKKYFSDILFMGRIEDQKNLPLFIKIIKLVSQNNPKLKVKIIGHGSRLKQIKKLVCQEKLEKIIKFISSTSEPQNYYSHAKIFLLTSLYEGFPLTLMEAISCNCHPVVNNLPEINKFISRYQSDIIFNNETEAVKIINSVLQKPNPKLISYYQNKLLKTQTRDFNQYLKHIIG